MNLRSKLQVCGGVEPRCPTAPCAGLINTTYGIAHGFVDLEPEVIGLQQTGGEGAAGALTLVKRELNNNDPLYSQIRSTNFGELGPLLNRLAREVRDGYEGRHDAHTVSQIRTFAGVRIL